MNQLKAKYAHLLYGLCLVLLFAVLSAPQALAQLRLTVQAPDSVDMSEPYFQIRYSIEAQVDGSITLPAINGLRRLAGPGTSFSSATVVENGRAHSQQSTTFTYTFAPQDKGIIVIPPAKVTVRGKTYTSPKIRIKVTDNGKPSSKKGGEPEELREVGSRVGKDELFVTATMGRDEVYVQEALPLTYTVYEKSGVGLDNIAPSQQPDFKGMVSQPIYPHTLQWDVERRDGTLMRKAVICQYLLYPQQAGEVTLPRLTFDCAVKQRESFMNAIDAYFNSGGTLTQILHRQANACKVRVRPLPMPQPAGFSGAVGQMHAKAYLVSPSVRTNESATLRINVSGKGNLQLLTAPKVILPAHCDAYTPKVTPQTTVTEESIEGSVTFDYTFVPRQTGDTILQVPPFVYFDPAVGQYRTDSIAPIALHIEEGERTQEEVARERELLQSDIRPIYEGKIALHDVGAAFFFWGTWGYYLCLVLIVAAAMAVFFLTRFLNVHREKNGVPRGGKALREAIKSIQKAQKTIADTDKAACYGQLATAMTTFVAAKAKVPHSEITKTNLPALLQAHGINDEDATLYLRLLEQCEWVKFAPIDSDSSPSGDARQAIDLMKRTDKAWK